MMHSHGRARHWWAVVLVAALALTACTDDSPPPNVATGSARPTSPQRPVPTDANCALRSPNGNPAVNDLPVQPLTTSLPVLEGLSTFQLIVCQSRAVAPDWQWGRPSIGQNELVFSLNFWWTAACGPGRNHDLRRLYGFVDMQQPYAAQITAWTLQGSCGRFISVNSSGQSGRQRTYDLEIRLQKVDGSVEVRPQATYQLEFIAAGSAQCPRCQYNHWVITGVS